MAAALERSRSDDPEVRYQAAQDLANTPDEAVVARLVELLSDDAQVMVDEGSSIHDVDPTYATVARAAHDALLRLCDVAWPAALAALPTAGPGVDRRLWEVLARVSPRVRAAMPDEAHAVLVATAESRGAGWSPEVARWERDFARRVRTGEVQGDEAFWRARLHGHPNGYTRQDALVRLARAVRDQAAFARELAECRGPLDVDRPPLHRARDDVAAGLAAKAAGAGPGRPGAALGRGGPRLAAALASADPNEAERARLVQVYVGEAPRGWARPEIAAKRLPP